MPRGSLENHLLKRISPSLAWRTRLKISIGAVKGLSFLHGAHRPVMYPDFETSNILLDYVTLQSWTLSATGSPQARSNAPTDLWFSLTANRNLAARSSLGAIFFSTAYA
ncbi:hypothetical protein MRB53_032601 [Persea americana]|uniref:Uncharacterized protein n=1 Tax=Persea americana TaxID=3435 RepID=A0ACC2KS73_PERAE|nr:hypothetical protein MRB53_032601 [Persea americana]